MAREINFSKTEARALLWLLPVLAIVSWLVWEIANNRAENIVPATEVQTIDSLFVFDPNTIDYHDLMRLGFSRGEALGIVKYRERGKVFEIPEDFAACYQVSEAMYRRLKNHIKIGEKFRLKRFEKRENFSVREEKDGVKKERTSINLNTADSATLRSVAGIGEKTVVGIMAYREQLGGFARAEQLLEVRGVRPENYERIAGQIFVDTLDIQKFDVNFAGAKRLAAHPYIKGKALRKLLSLRQLKGGWHNTQELIADSIFSNAEVEKLRPYLLFGKAE